MASAFQDRGGWIVRFRGLGGVRRSVRVAAADKEDADGLAMECERYCRRLEGAAGRPDPEDIRHAARIKAISAEQATELQGGPAAPARGRLTIAQAMAMHPSSSREGLDSQIRHTRALKAFESFSGLVYLDEVSLPVVQQWVAAMAVQGQAWDTRRHQLVALRRATRMGASIGIPDVLGGLRIDAQPPRPPVAVWSLPELVAAVPGYRAAGDGALAALALGGFLGLRSSEICRASVGDLEGDVLTVGARARKTGSSYRRLPLPGIVAEWVRRACGSRAPEAPIVRAKGGRNFTLNGYCQYMGPLARQHLPPRPKAHLRASFATWASRILPPAAVERILGHRVSGVAAVSARHYLGEAEAADLRPHAASLDAAIRAALGPGCLHDLSTNGVSTCGARA